MLSYMTSARESPLYAIWSGQSRIPVAFMDTSPAPLLVRLPFRADNKLWLRNNRLRRPTWLPGYKCWQLPRAWFNDFTERVLRRYGQLYVIQPVHRHEKCAPACWNARGLDCECSCLGQHHGQGYPGGSWFVVSEACAVSYDCQDYASRLLTVKKTLPG